jgi:thymidylate synthase ThyX
MKRAFLSPAPEVRLVRRTENSFDLAVATARTCYSGKGIVTPEEVAGAGQPTEIVVARRSKRDELAADLYQAGHHTTFQHAYFQFSIANVSRQCLWSFLHSHPFYNSEQVSQRYVTVKDGNYAVPPLEGQARTSYLETAERMVADYRRLSVELEPLCARVFYERFPARRAQPDRWAKEIRKKAQEIARYVLPVATFAYLYHTVSAVTLFRYRRLCELHDAPFEQRLLVEQMVAEVLRHEPDYATLLQQPIPHLETVEAQALASLGARPPRRDFARRFDEGLDGRISRLVDWGRDAEATVAESVREVLGALPDEIDDDQALRWVLDPSRNRYLGEALNLDTLSKLTRCLSHSHYVFRKKLSHTADSQDQRHRMTPASRPILAAQIDGEPDVVLPSLLQLDDGLRQEFTRSWENAWEGMRRVRAAGAEEQFVQYLLPNAVAIRFTESADLLHLHHKHTMRLCYNAQEEIWRASLEEARQIRDVHPRLGSWLLPPCTQRAMAGQKPPCPEGARYCGVPVWRIDLDRYERTL